MSSRDTIGERSRTHGMSDTRLYRIWCGIKGRCSNENIEHYDRYGGRGIKVCEAWELSFEAFRDWSFSAGYDENKSGKEQSLDRIDANGDYSPENCRWADIKQQARNRTDTVYIKENGKEIPAREFAEKHNISNYVFVFRRIKKGDSAEKILKDWDMRHNTPEGFMTVTQAAKYYNVSEISILNWLKKNKITAKKYGQKWYIPKEQNDPAMQGGH